MIEGLKVTIPGAELRELCIKQADYHRERALFYLENVKALEGVPNKHTQHENAARELVFISDHLKVFEEYQLTAADLQRLGIVGRQLF